MIRVTVGWAGVGLLTSSSSIVRLRTANMSGNSLRTFAAAEPSGGVSGLDCRARLMSSGTGPPKLSCDGMVCLAGQFWPAATGQPPNPHPSRPSGGLESKAATQPELPLLAAFGHFGSHPMHDPTIHRLGSRGLSLDSLVGQLWRRDNTINQPSVISARSYIFILSCRLIGNSLCVATCSLQRYLKLCLSSHRRTSQLHLSSHHPARHPCGPAE